MSNDIRNGLRKLAARPPLTHLRYGSFSGWVAISREGRASPDELFGQARFLEIVGEQKVNGQYPPSDLFIRAIPAYEAILKLRGGLLFHKKQHLDMLMGGINLICDISSGIAFFGASCPEYEMAVALNSWFDRWKLNGIGFYVFAAAALVHGTWESGTEITTSAKVGWNRAVTDMLNWGQAMNMDGDPEKYKPPATFDAYFGVERDKYVEQRINEARLLLNTGVLAALEDSDKNNITDQVRSVLNNYCDKVDSALKGSACHRRKREEAEFERAINWIVRRVIGDIKWLTLADEEDERTRKQFIEFSKIRRHRLALLRVQKGVRTTLDLIKLPRTAAFPNSRVLKDDLPEHASFADFLAVHVDETRRLMLARVSPSLNKEGRN